MRQPIPIVLLPGLDGTGELFKPFVQALPATFRPLVMRYPTDEVLDYEDLVKRVMPQLPEEPYIILGESFSGPLSILLAHRAQHRPAGLILCATFASSPRPVLSRWMDVLPSLPPTESISPWAMKQVALGRWSHPDLLETMGRALLRVKSDVLHSRLMSVHRADARLALAECRMPIQYWQATEDRLIPAAAFTRIRRIAPLVQLVRLEGPHAILQACPQLAVVALEKFTRELGLA
jgi:pimeloyl-ACP methyl ester carboxylesterase